MSSKCAKADETEQHKFFQTFPNLSNLAFSNCSENVQNVIQIALKWLFFQKNCKIRLDTFAPSPHSGNLFFHTQASQPTTFKIIITGFLNKKCNKMQPLL